jgi:hypothetical protein
MEEIQKTFAIIKNGIVENAIIGESLAVLSALVPDAELVEQTDSTGIVFINGTYEDGVFYPEQPHDSWVLDKEERMWFPPKAHPENVPAGKFVQWNEEKIDWDILDIPIAN